MEAYKKTLEGIGTFFTATSHHNSGTVIDFVSSTEARTRTIVLAVHRYAKDRPDGILHGQYHDTLVEVDGAWKFKTRELRTALTTDYHVRAGNPIGRSEEHTSELQSLMRISYAVFCLKKNKQTKDTPIPYQS